MQPGLRHLARTQEGILHRAQLAGAGLRDHDVRRLVRRHELVPVHRGVYAVHTGPLSWDARAWAAVLAHRPSALAGPAALRAHGLRSGAAADHDPVLVAVDGRRSGEPRAGTRVVRVNDLDRVALWQLGPPRLRVEHAALTVASAAARDDEAVAVLGDAVGGRRTTPARLARELEQLTRLPRRGLLRDVLEDVDGGSHTALERRWLRDVERRHGLPTSVRQRRRSGGGRTRVEDVALPAYGVVVELDGRLGHDLAAERWWDLERTLLAAAAGDLTLRVGWLQLLQPCRTAGLVGAVLRARGWPGLPGCPDCNDVGGLQSPGDHNPPTST